MNFAIMVIALALGIGVGQRSRPLLNRPSLTGLVALLLLAPFMSGNLLTLTGVFIAGTAAIGWNIIGGFTGYASFGQSAFFGLGGYTTAVMVARGAGVYGQPAPVGVVLGGVVATLAALLIGIVVLRLRGHYFAIATLGIGIAVRELVNNVDCVALPGSDTPLFCLGAASGIILPPNHKQDLATANLTFYFAGLALFGLAVGALMLLNRSKFGYGLRAIREGEEAAAVMGVNTTLFKVAAFAGGALFTGFAGGLQTLINGSVLPDQTSIFDPYRSLEVIIICLIGGVGTVWGPVIGTFALYAIQEILSSTLGAGDWRPVFFGAIVILLVLFLPRGILQFFGTRRAPGLRVLWRNLLENRV